MSVLMTAPIRLIRRLDLETLYHNQTVYHRSRGLSSSRPASGVSERWKQEPAEASSRVCRAAGKVAVVRSGQCMCGHGPPCAGSPVRDAPAARLIRCQNRVARR